MSGRHALRAAVVAYVALLVGLPVAFVFDRAFAHGLGPFVDALRDPFLRSAIWLTVRVALLAVPLNVVFGVGASLWIVRRPSWFTRALDTVIDVPLAVSPIIIGLVLVLAYAQGGWLGGAIARLGWRVMFSLPAIVIASVFVSLPLVSRQVIPLLREVGDHQERTAATLGAGPVRIFLTITLRSIMWALAYGVSLTLARVIGEYGAVLIVSGNVQGLTQTLTLNIGASFENYTPFQGFVGASLLAFASLAVLSVIGVARSRERRRHEHLA